VRQLVDQIIDFAGIGAFIDMPVQHYSSGMHLRLAYAVAAHLHPDVLLVDEVLAVGDLAFRRKCLQHMQKYLQAGGALILVSHNLYEMQSICSRSLVLDRGRVLFAGTAVEGVNRYMELQWNRPVNAPEEHRQMRLSDDNATVIEGVTICSVDGSELRCGMDARLILRYRSHQEIERVYWGFVVLTADLTTCVVARLTGPSDGECRLERGVGELCCTIPRLPLNGGVYALRAAILDAETRAPIARLGWQNAPSFFTVESEASEVSNVQSLQRALVTMDVRWERSEEISA
jgi:lipopolysaccharide transport system ATP-binding protein